jgi:predicted GNAT family acetyltransferase
MLYTNLANPASNRIYRRIGCAPACDVTEYRFVPRG